MTAALVNSVTDIANSLVVLQPTTVNFCLRIAMYQYLMFLKESCSPGRGLLLFSSTPRNETGDMPRENCQTVPVTL